MGFYPSSNNNTSLPTTPVIRTGFWQPRASTTVTQPAPPYPNNNYFSVQSPNNNYFVIKPATQSAPTEVILPLGTTVDLLYGERQIEATKVVYCDVGTTYTTVIWVLGQGEFSYIDISTLRIGDKASSTFSGLQVETYRGSPDANVPPTILNALGPTLNDFNNSGRSAFAYLCIKFPLTADIQGWPSVKLKCKGRKCYDPRDVTTSPTNPSTWKYSDNPFIVKMNFMMWAEGLNISHSDIDKSSVSLFADQADVVLTSPDGTPSKMWQFNYLFSGVSRQEVLDIIDLHSMGGMAMKDGFYFLDCDTWIKGIYTGFTDDEITNFEKYPVDANEIKNYVKATFTDTVTDPNNWATAPIEDVYDPTPEGAYYIEQLDLSGFLLATQARRIQIQKYNARISQRPYVFETYNSKGLRRGQMFILALDRLGIMDTYVCTAIQTGTDSTTIHCRKCDPEIYSQVAIDEPVFSEWYLPSPYDTPTDPVWPASPLKFLEELFQQQSDGTWLENIIVRFRASSFPSVVSYEIFLKEEGGEFFHVKTLPYDTTNYMIRGVRDGVTYTVKVVARSMAGYTSPGLEGTVKCLGKYLHPVWKSGATVTGQESGDTVFLRWYMPDGSPPAIDYDIVGYEIRRGRTTDTWDSSVIVNPRVDTLTWQDKSCPAGTWRFFVQAVDSVGNYACLDNTVGNPVDVPLYCDVTVVLNPYFGYQADHDFDLSTTVSNT